MPAMANGSGDPNHFPNHEGTGAHQQGPIPEEQAALKSSLFVGFQSAEKTECQQAVPYWPGDDLAEA
jgi:hypothetical protein